MQIKMEEDCEEPTKSNKEEFEEPEAKEVLRIENEKDGTKILLASSSMSMEGLILSAWEIQNNFFNRKLNDVPGYIQ